MRTKRRSKCPVACTLDLLGDRWTLLIIRDLLCGKTQFKEFAASPEKIATNVLTDRLQRLVRSGLAEKHAPNEFPGREVYRLTNKGESLLPLLEAIRDWGLTHIRGTEVRMQRPGN